MLFVFDIDGTLTKNNDVATEAFRETVYSLFKISKYKEEWKEYINDSDTGIINELIFIYHQRPVTGSELIHFQENYLQCFNKLLKTKGKEVLPVDGVNAFFEQIRNNSNVKTALFTGGFPKIAKRKLDLISIDNSLLLSAAFDGWSREKIFLNCILCAEKKYQTKFDKIILFGDSISDMKIANKFNVPLIGITTQFSAEFFTAAGAKASIPNYKNIRIEELISYVNC